MHEERLLDLQAQAADYLRSHPAPEQVHGIWFDLPDEFGYAQFTVPEHVELAREFLRILQEHGVPHVDNGVYRPEYESPYHEATPQPKETTDE